MAVTGGVTGPEPTVNQGSNRVRREAVLAGRMAPRPHTGHPSVWHPWEATAQQAHANMRAEVTDALRQLERDLGQAQHILDQAVAVAAEARSAIMDAAAKFWAEQLAAAGRADDAIMAPAQHAYSEALAKAHADFGAAMTRAEVAYRAELADADRAKSLAAAAPLSAAG